MEPSWVLLGPSWSLLGPSWGLLGPSWGLLGHLGSSWGHLGAILGFLGAILGSLAPSLALLRPPWRLLALKATLGSLEPHLGASVGLSECSSQFTLSPTSLLKASAFNQSRCSLRFLGPQVFQDGAVFCFHVCLSWIHIANSFIQFLDIFCQGCPWTRRIGFH